MKQFFFFLGGGGGGGGKTKPSLGLGTGFTLKLSKNDVLLHKLYSIN